MLSIAGLIYTMLGEGFCSGVPVSRIVADTIQYGQQLTTAQIFDAAAAAVVDVPEDFIYETEHATTPAALHNGVSEAFVNGNFGVFDQE